MRLGVPKESKRGETRVAATPKTVEQLIKLGYEVVEAASAAEPIRGNAISSSAAVTSLAPMPRPSSSDGTSVWWKLIRSPDRRYSATAVTPSTVSS